MPTDHNGELALIDAAKRGDVEAFTRLVAVHRQALFRYLLMRSPSHADAEDSLQDTLINAYRYLETYDPRWRFSTWLYRIAVRNTYRNRPERAVRIDGDEVCELADAEGDPLARCAAASERENLWRAARRLLSAEVYTAMWLRYVEDLSIRDISHVLGRSVSWTKVNLLRGRGVLESELKERPEKAGCEAYG